MINSSNATNVHQDIAFLAAGPSKWARRYTGYLVNGLRFHTKKREMMRKTQNSGVFLNASMSSFSSSKDKNPILGDVSFYGVLKDIIEVRYTNDIKFILFKCDWVDRNSGLKHDEFNFTLVNFAHLLYRGNVMDEPFILASQAQQAWYIQDPVDPDWHVALKMTPRAIFNVDPEINEFGSTEDELFSYQGETNIENEIISYARADVEGETLVRSDHSDENRVHDLEQGPDHSASDDFDPNDDDDFFEDVIPPNESEDD